MCGRALAQVKNGDPITIDAEKRELSLGVSATDLELRRKASWKAPAPRYTRGVLADVQRGDFRFAGRGYGFDFVRAARDKRNAPCRFPPPGPPSARAGGA